MDKRSIQRARKTVVLATVAALTGSLLTLVPGSGPVTPVRPAPITEAPDSAAAMAAAWRQGSRVEVADQRTPTRAVYANPGGTLTAELSPAPVRVRQPHGWAKIDTELGKRADGSIKPKAADGDLALSPGGNAPLATLRRDGKTLTLRWPTELPAPVLDGNAATYPEVLPGADLVMYADRDGFRQHLVLKNAEAAKNPALKSIRLGMRADGLKVTVDSGGAIHAADETGAELFAAPPSTMWDAAGRTTAVGVSIVDDALVLTPDQKFLADPALKFPVTVDPTLHTFYKTAWATVLSGYSGTSYWNSSGDGTYAQVGQCPRDLPPSGSWCNGIGEAWSYFQYDTGFLWDKTLIGATLDTTVVSSPACADRIIDLYHVGPEIWNGMTWNSKLNGGRVASRWMPSVQGGCTGWKNAGIDVPLGEVEQGSPTAFFLKAQDSNDQYAWRKYDPGQMTFRVTYNRTPYVPANLATDQPLPAPCRWCEGKPYIGADSVRLMATLSDPDGDMVRAQWRISHNGTEVASWDEPGMQASGAVHSTVVDTSGLDGKTVGWWLHSSDGVTSSGLAAGQSFAVDRTPVTQQPTVAGELYTEDGRWHGGSEVADTFTFGSNGVGDIDHYLYGWQDPPSTRVDATSLGGPATVTLTPPGDGPRTLYVRSVDRANHESESRPYRFYVRAGSGPLAQWSFEGNAQDSAFLGDRHGTLGNGAGYTAQGATGSAVQLDGVDDYVSAPNAVRNSAPFTVSAWVNLTRNNGARAAVSQDGALYPGYVLWYRAEQDGSNPRWVFGLPNSTTEYRGATFASSPAGMPQLNTWTHLAGVYDPAAQQIRLYVNGKLAATEPQTTRPDFANGPVRIGRTMWPGTPAVDHWPGAVDEVQIHDRALSAAEIAASVSAADVQLAHFKFDETSGTTAHNAVASGADAVLQNGAAFTQDGAVAGGLRLDGVDDTATTTGPLTRTDQSFSVAAQVKLDRADNGTYTVLSQDGEKICAFCLQYQSNHWVFVFPQSDEDTPVGYNWVGTSTQPPAGVWTHLAGTYDATTGKIRLYVDGELIGESTRVSPWHAKRAFRIGSATIRAQVEQRLPGTVDEVRVYSRAISQDEVRGLVSRDNVTAGTWKLDGNADDANKKADGTSKLPGALIGNPDWAAGQVSLPDPGDLAVRLNGSNQNISTPNAVDTGKSFSVTAWARLDDTGPQATVLSQDGNTASGFMLRAISGKWTFVAMGSDANVAGDQATGPSAQRGIWTHLAGVYSKDRQQIELYVNGVLAASAPHSGGFNATGGFQIGRGKWNGGDVDFFPGAIDDVSVYSRTLLGGEIKNLAGRDVSLGHNWTLDEGSGTAGGDSAGTKQATLTGGAGFTAGRVGNAIRLDGTDDAAATAGVDVRTDSSFTVSSWVRLDGNDCDIDTTPRCMLSAVSLDGGGSRPSSKFRLGHVTDDAGHMGNWVFEMPEEDGTVTKAALEVIPGELNAWVHLVGVYDVSAKAIFLYVNGTRKDDGTLLNPWQATGGLQIGRGRDGGAYAGYWKGAVDDVRMYSGALTADRVSALYRGYPAPGGAALPVADAGRWKFDENTGTTVADASGRGRTATMAGGAGWHTGRDAYTGWFNGTSAYAETAGPVVNTGGSFSVAAWAYLTDGSRYVTVFGQDGNQISPFYVQYDPTVKKWGAVVPKTDQTNFSPHYVLSSETAEVGVWTHLTVVYDAQLGQLRLYVNGSLSGVQTGVSVLPADGKFSIGRCRWGTGNACYFPGGIEEVRAYGKALSDGEVRKVHDDIPPASHGNWRFDDGTVKDSSWLKNPTTVTGTATFTAGVQNKALQLDGASSLTGDYLGVTMRDSFTVSAWAKLSRGDKVATVLGQDGDRNSGFVLQYRPEVGRWIFGAAAQDADQPDTTPLRYANSLHAPALNTWTHLTGVYDYPARQLRLYVNGELVGTKDNMLLWSAWGGFTIGRGKANGAPTGLFTGAIDDVTADFGAVPDDEIRLRAGWPAPAGGQLGRFIAAGDHRTVNSTDGTRQQFGQVPAGYHFEAPLGTMLSAEAPGTRRLYTCLINNTDSFTSMDPACEGFTKLADLGWAYTEQPAGVATVPLYRCVSGTERFDSNSTTCEGKTVDGLLGYTLAYAPLTRYYHPRIAEHAVTAAGVPPGYRHEGTFGSIAMTNEPGTQALMSCVDGSDRFLSTDPACGGKTVEVPIGYLWTEAPAGRASTQLFQCSLNSGPSAGELFVSWESNCEGQTVRGPLGYIIKEVPSA
ncbi:LamG domain-containing protein [Amycolatopsis sp. NPDC059657]|uniref:LamG domain-containing protein n=1 Tax=Amycolatopsis sp. NPDC059657 TaxID=3346899 RepID=UPI003670513A